jgi:hypothetical protein
MVVDEKARERSGLIELENKDRMGSRKGFIQKLNRGRRERERKEGIMERLSHGDGMTQPSSEDESDQIACKKQQMDGT